MRGPLFLDTSTIVLLLDLLMDGQLEMLGLYSHNRSPMSVLVRANLRHPLERWIVQNLFGVWSDEGFLLEGAPSPREYEWLYGLRELLRDDPGLSDWKWLAKILEPNERWGHFNDPAFDLTEAFERFGGVSIQIPPLRDRLRNLSRWVLRLSDKASDWTSWRHFPATLEWAFPVRAYHDDAELQAREEILATYHSGDSSGKDLVHTSDRLILRLLELQQNS